MDNAQVTRRSLMGGAAASTAAVALSGAPAHAARQLRAKQADLVVVNGDVLAMNKRFTRGTALAIRDGRVMGVGSRGEIRRLMGRRTEVVNANGGTVLPGINDSHVHSNSLGLTLPPFSYNVDTGTIEELVAVVATAVQAAPSPDSWVRGTGWNDNRLPRAPRREDLDAVSGAHPVILTDFSFHAIAVNSVALQIAGITRNTVAPPGGVIEKDDSGEPTGVLRETAMGLVQQFVPARTSEELSASIDVGIAQLHTQGITSITEPGIGVDVLGIYADKARAGALPLRVTALLRGGNSVRSLRSVLEAYEPLRGVDRRFLRVAGIKLIADGIPTAAQTAWLHEPYLDGTNGALLTVGDTVEEQVATLHRMIRIAVRNGFQVGTHATGDAAIDAVVEGYLQAMGRNWRRTDLRHYVIHGDLTPRATLRKMARHDIGVNMNATIKYLLGRTLDPVLGPERTDYQWPYRTAPELGVRVSSSSDAPVTSPNWLQGVMAARLREGMFGGVAGKDERISVRKALVTFTRTPAWQDHALWKGTLQKGKAADVCIVNGDVLGVHPRELVNLSISHTIVNGQVVYDASAGSGARARAGASASTAGWSHERSASCLENGMCCCRVADQLAQS